MWPSKKSSLFVTREVLKQVADECKKFETVETGGLLIGYHKGSEIVITHSTGPGPRAQHKRTSLTMDLNYIRSKLREHEDRLPVGYEGNWHTHPKAKFIFPSTDDQRLLLDIVTSDEYDVSRAVLLIVPEHPMDVSDYHFYLFDAQWKKYRKVAPQVCSNPFG